jgi:hypothetical protein
MTGLIRIIYGLDSSGNSLSVMINPDRVTSAESSENLFTLILSSVNTTSDLSSTNPGNLAFGTSLTITSASGTSSQISQIWYTAVDEVRRGTVMPEINLVTLGATLTKRTIIAY